MELGSPELLADQDFITSLGVAFIVSTLICFFLCCFTTQWIVRILELPYWIYAVIIMGVIVWSCLQYTGTWNDFYILLICSFLGMICYRYKISRPAVLVAYILSEKLENYSQQALTLYSTSDLLQRPIFITLVIVSICVITWSLLRKNRGIDYT